MCWHGMKKWNETAPKWEQSKLSDASVACCLSDWIFTVRWYHLLLSATFLRIKFNSILARFVGHRYCYTSAPNKWPWGALEGAPERYERLSVVSCKILLDPLCKYWTPLSNMNVAVFMGVVLRIHKPNRTFNSSRLTLETKRCRTTWETWSVSPAPERRVYPAYIPSLKHKHMAATLYRDLTAQ